MLPFKVTQLHIGPEKNFAYVLVDEETRHSAIVDPGFDPEKILRAAADTEVKLVLLTHGHGDHVAQAPRIVERTGARVVAHGSFRGKKDIAVTGRDPIALGRSSILPVPTPGHQPDSISFVAAPYIFTGDTLFVGECGRADLPGSDPRQLGDSLLRVLRGLDPNLVVLPGHDYGPRPQSTLREEFETNYTLKPRSLDEFERFVLS
ncbi:MAG: MBL fold metallo-hydrolase [Thermoplasmatota archaeon]